MFELEIMVTGYTIVVATTAVVVSTCIGRKKLNKISKELSVSNADLVNAQDEIKKLKISLRELSVSK